MHNDTLRIRVKAERARSALEIRRPSPSDANRPAPRAAVETLLTEVPYANVRARLRIEPTRRHWR